MEYRAATSKRHARTKPAAVKHVCGAQPNLALDDWAMPFGITEGSAFPAAPTPTLG